MQSRLDCVINWFLSAGGVAYLTSAQYLGEGMVTELRGARCLTNRYSPFLLATLIKRATLYLRMRKYDSSRPKTRFPAN